MHTPPRRLLATLALVALLALSGCAQVAVHSTVAADGTLEEYRLELTTSRTVYGLLEQSAEEEGHDSMRASIASELELGDVPADRVEYDESFDGDEVTMTLAVRDLDPAELDNLTVTVEDDRVVFEDLTFVDETAATADVEETNLSRAMTAGFAVDYSLTMPGDVVDSNADEVDGNAAEWHETGADAFTGTRIYAVSERPTSATVPGFGAAAALLAVALVSLAAWWRRP